MPGLEIIEHEGTNYITGLFWQTLDNIDRQQRESRDLAEELGFDRVALIDYPALQAGYAEKDHLPDQWQQSGNIYSLAGHLAQSEPGSWIGIFPLGKNRYYFFAINKDVILPEGEFIGNKEEVEEKLSEVRNQGGGWSAIYAPEEFGNFKERSLAEVLDEDESAPPLNPTRFELTRDFLVQAGTTVGLAFAMALSMYLFWPSISTYVVGSGGETVVVEKEVPEPEPEPDSDPKTVSEDTEPVEPKPEPKPEPEPDFTPPPAEGENWRTAQPAGELLRTCAQFYQSTPFYEGGWTLSEWACGPLTLRATYSQDQTGTGLSGAPPAIGKPQELVYPNSGGVQVRLRVAKAHEEPPKGYPSPDRFIAQLRYSTPSTIAVENSLAAQSKRPGLRKTVVEWSQDTPPFEFGENGGTGLLNNEAFRLFSVTRSFNSSGGSGGSGQGAWTIRGALYYYGEVNSGGE